MQLPSATVRQCHRNSRWPKEITTAVRSIRPIIGCTQHLFDLHIPTGTLTQIGIRMYESDESTSEVAAAIRSMHIPDLSDYAMNNVMDINANQDITSGF